jgi:GNAT superfamily N-acetyltransferase
MRTKDGEFMKPEGYPKIRSLKDGRPVTLRLQVPDDALALHAFYNALPEDDRMFLDDDVTRPEWVVRFVARSDFESIYPLVAEQGGKIVGHAWLARSRYGWMKHVGQLRLAVARECQRQGLGSELAREILRIAINVGLEKMTVRLMDSQTGPIRAFERIGFKPEATLHGHVRDARGRVRSLVLMGNDIAQIWKAMETLVADLPPTRELFHG